MTDCILDWPFSGINLSIAPIIKTTTGKEADATGFFFQHNNIEYLITNLHVVKNNKPNFLKIKTHSKIKREYYEIQINLYDDFGTKLWLQSNKANIDIILIPLTPKRLENTLYVAPKTLNEENYLKFINSKINTFSKDNFLDKNNLLPAMADVGVVGYPKGFYDKENNLPTYKKGMLASAYPQYFNDEPYFVIDANLHEGSSGSCVVNHPSNILTKKNNQARYHTNKSILLGIHSAEMGEKIKAKDINRITKTITNSLNLNRVFYAELILDIINENL